MIAGRFCPLKAWRTRRCGGTHTHSFTTDQAGSGNSHQNMPPAIVLNKIIKT